MIKEKQALPLTELTAICILDGRNRNDVLEIPSYTSEYNIIKTRVEVEARYLIALSETGIVRPLSNQERNKLNHLGESFTLDDAQKVKEIEKITDHDVKAMERVFRTKLQGTSLQDITEKVHIGLTSEDVNNLVYRLILRRITNEVFIPELDILIDELVKRAEENKALPMLARTHGRKASSTTLGKELAVFAKRLNKEVRDLENRPLTGKMTGAVGNLNAIRSAYPNINWLVFSEKFVKSFGFEPNLTTIQINSYEDMIAYFQNYLRINGVVLDFDQDIWRYISDDWFVQEVKTGEVGSSAMPQKVNPWRIENSEGNLGKANALFEYFARELATSRLQRHIKDSTIVKDMGLPLGWSLLSYRNTLNQLSRIKPYYPEIEAALNKDWSILSESAQTIMRRAGIEDPHALMLKLTRGKHIGEKRWLGLVSKLPLSGQDKEDLKNLRPATNIGYSVEITEQTIKEINNSKKTKN